MASHTEAERPEVIELEILIEHLTKTYTGDPIMLTELKEFIDSLSKEDKLVIYLRYFGLTTEELASELRVTKRRIEQRIKKIRERAKKWLG